MDVIRETLARWGIGDAWIEPIGRGSALIGVLLIAWLVGFVARRAVVRTATAIAERTEARWDDFFVAHNVWGRIAHLAPALVVYLVAPLALGGDERVGRVVQAGVFVYIIVVALLILDSVLNALLDIYRDLPVAREIPLKGFAQVAKILLVGFGIIYIVSIIVGRSPWLLVSGLGAMTAVLLLIFKDAILGLVAGIQLSANRMVATGDWIEMPRYGADGDVIEVALTTVKVRNWDKTITTIPTYALISESFKNWRGMQESGGRRIKRSVLIDMNSIRFCDEAMLERFRKVEILRDYLERKSREIREFNDELGVDSASLVNGRRLTNVGTFRAYVVEYLKRHPQIHPQMTFLVRQLAPGPHGLPIEIYVFSRDQVWANYEAIQADIFDHVLAAVSEFDLRVFQMPVGADLRALAAGGLTASATTGSGGGEA